LCIGTGNSLSKMSTQSEERTEGLVRDAVGGDPEAFSRLFHRIRGRLEVWISLRMGPLLRKRLSPDDVLQETLLEAHRSLARFHDQGSGSFQRWVYSVAENRIRDLHKFHTAQKRDAAREARPEGPRDEEVEILKHLAGDDPSPSAGMRGQEVSARLAESIERLPDPLREVLVLRAIEERTYAEIAERLERPAATVRVLFCRALKRLRDDLGATGTVVL
jgi:RNA polymerase sigma-70 factor (ECF subfamily)